MWRNRGMKFVVGENGRNTMKNQPRTRLFHNETHTQQSRSDLTDERR